MDFYLNKLLTSSKDMKRTEYAKTAACMMTAENAATFTSRQ